MVIAIGLNYTTGLLKVIFIPYLYYLLNDRRLENIPSLLVIFGQGTILNFVGTLIIIPIVWKSITKSENLFIRNSFYCLLLLLPIYLGLTFYRISSGIDLVEAIVMNEYYFAFFFLFYGYILVGLLSNRVILELTKAGLLIIALVLVVGELDELKLLMRNGAYFVYGSLLLIGFYLIYEGKIASITLLSLLSLAIFGWSLELQFTPLIQIVVASYIVLRLKVFKKGVFHQKKTLRDTEKKIIILFPIIFLIITLKLLPGIDIQENRQNQSSSYITLENAKFKIFEDRGVLWKGVLTGIEENTSLLPPIAEWNIEFETMEGAQMEVNYESHNLLLGLLKKNGFISGVVLIIIYLLSLYYALGNVSFVDKNAVVICSVVIGAGVAVFLTGQFTLQQNASFFYMIIIGALNRKREKNIINL